MAVALGPAPPKLMSKLVSPAQSLLTVAYSFQTLPVVMIPRVTVGVAWATTTIVIKTGAISRKDFMATLSLSVCGDQAPIPICGYKGQVSVLTDLREHSSFCDASGVP